MYWSLNPRIDVLYVDDASKVPELSSVIVNSTVSWYATAWPSITQSVVLESPKYSVLDVILSRESKFVVLLEQTGSGTHDLRLNEDRGSQPPKQYAPAPHWPYSKPKLSALDTKKQKRVTHESSRVLIRGTWSFDYRLFEPRQLLKRWLEPQLLLMYGPCFRTRASECNEREDCWREGRSQ